MEGTVALKHAMVARGVLEQPPSAAPTTWSTPPPPALASAQGP